MTVALVAALALAAVAGWAFALVLARRLRRVGAAASGELALAATLGDGAPDSDIDLTAAVGPVREFDPAPARWSTSEGGAEVPGPHRVGAAGAVLPAALVDPATGLFNQEYFLVTLESRISAARRHLRPVALALVEVAQGVKEGSPAPIDALAVADGLRATLREADTACWLPNGSFALVLEDTPENGAVWTVERLRRHLVIHHPGQTLWAGVACYPAHAFDAGHVLERANLALAAAKDWRQDRIEVATADS